MLNGVNMCCVTHQPSHQQSFHVVVAMSAWSPGL